MGYFSDLNIEYENDREQLSSNCQIDTANKNYEQSVQSKPVGQSNSIEATSDADKKTQAAEQNEEVKRKSHEEAEEKRKAEWEEQIKAKEEAEWEKAISVNNDILIEASVKRLGEDYERFTRRNMKQCVTEYVQTKCYEDLNFAKYVLHPRKNLINCFKYINRKAKSYLDEEMKINDEKPINGIYGGDVPDDLCYRWAEDYFLNMDIEEDKDKGEKIIISKPHLATSNQRAKKKANQEKKSSKLDEVKVNEEQLTLFGGTI